jgi:hypothetical protein
MTGEAAENVGSNDSTSPCGDGPLGRLHVPLGLF